MWKFFTREVVEIFPVPQYIVFNVVNFNSWFINPGNNAVYANSGIFLRLDKLDEAHITDYLEKCYGIVDGDCEDIKEFEKEIREDWKHKIKRRASEY